MKALRRNKCATSIQSTWRACSKRIEYKKAILGVVLIQTIARRLFSLRISCVLREKKQIVECNAATKISSWWRGHISLRNYRHTILNFICVQSLARKWIAVRHSLRLRERDVAAAVIIQTSLGRKFIASRDAAKRKEEKQMTENAATMISTLWRGRICYSGYKQTVKGTSCSLHYLGLLGFLTFSHKNSSLNRRCNNLSISCASLQSQISIQVSSS